MMSPKRRKKKQNKTPKDQADYYPSGQRLGTVWTYCYCIRECKLLPFGKADQWRRDIHNEMFGIDDSTCPDLNKILCDEVSE